MINGLNAKPTNMKKKTDLKDVTFLIPVRIDSIVRLENLLMVTEYLIMNFNTNIHILEASDYNNTLLLKLLPKEVDITWKEDHDPIFHRTHYINMLVNKCVTPYVAVWDTDVIAPIQQIIESIDLLRKRKSDFVSPYHKFLDTSSILRKMYFKTRESSVLCKNEQKMKSLYAPDPVGGAFFALKNVYIESGLENKNFYGWGIEDGERVRRWIILGYIYKRVKGSLYHLTHERGKNSQFHADGQYDLKTKELRRISSMSKEQLNNEVRLWK